MEAEVEPQALTVAAAPEADECANCKCSAPCLSRASACSSKVGGWPLPWHEDRRIRGRGARLVLFEEPSSSLPLLLLEPRSDLEAAPVEDLLLPPPLPCVDECEEEEVEREAAAARRVWF